MVIINYSVLDMLSLSFQGRKRSLEEEAESIIQSLYLDVVISRALWCLFSEKLVNYHCATK